jgi:hypothetical protein
VHICTEYFYLETLKKKGNKIFFNAHTIFLSQDME